MSVDIKWDAISSGPDGQILAESIRSFIDDKFQQVSLPRFIRSVKVHSFDFGKISPQIEIKDICDPLPDFYEQDDDETDDDDDGDDDAVEDHSADVQGSKDHETPSIEDQLLPGHVAQSGSAERSPRKPFRLPPQIDTRLPSVRSSLDPLNSPFHPLSGAPGLPSHLSYFHLPLRPLSGSHTPLAAVAGGTQFPHSGQPGFPFPQPAQRRDTGASVKSQSQSPTRPSTSDSLLTAVSPISDSPTPMRERHSNSNFIAGSSTPEQAQESQFAKRFRTPNPSDLQVVFNVHYAGDVRLSLTAEILLDYPMTSFMSIPLQLSITGLSFDGVAILAQIRKTCHFCFLSPEDGEALVGGDSRDAVGEDGRRVGDGDGDGLLREIRVESEIGRKGEGRQVLKNVGKVERFVLEQVRRIFEEEFVWPSFWTFLI